MANTCFAAPYRVLHEVHGSYSLPGTLRKNGVANAGRVFLFNRKTLKILDDEETSDGSFDFRGLSDQFSYMLVGQDEDSDPVGITADITLTKIEHPG